MMLSGVVAGCHEGEKSSCCHPSTWGVSMSAPGVDVARGHRGAGFPCRSDTEDLGAGGWTRSVLPLLLDARSVWEVKDGAAFYKINQQISARFDVTFQCRNKGGLLALHRGDAQVIFSRYLA